MGNMKKELEENLSNNLRQFFKKTNKYGEFKDTTNLLEYLAKKMALEGFKCHQQYSFSLKNTMIIYQKVEYINNITISSTIKVIIDEVTLKVVGVTKDEIKSYNEIIF